ncbi:siderophore-interacting protein [uncultured Sulfitobacter sp.]|uniref:siderophore-interacting protein n=1 Tax=uncultured Sulfitobacter sp. TaxID=191468 RepID=UPI0030D937DE|tara:strand:- start:176977 stop:178062 length:1086 start_codon:yes stop_codon:yes gene_type:complete
MAILTKETKMAHHHSNAMLEVPFIIAIRKIKSFAVSAGLNIEREEGGVLVRLGSGSLKVAGDRKTTSLELTAQSPAMLQQLRDAVALRMEKLETAVTWEAVVASSRHPANLSIATVASLERISPSYTRIVIDGPDLARFTEGSLHFRLLLGPDGAGWPEIDAGGVTTWPGGGMSAWHRPVYTTRSFELGADGAARLAFDVFLHDGGRVTEWTRDLAVGTEIAITGAGGGGRATNETKWHCLIGDETAMPVIARMLERLPLDAEGVAMVIIPDAKDAQDLIHPDGVSLNWVLRGENTNPTNILSQIELPDQDRFVYVAAERDEVAEARRYLKEHGLAKNEASCFSYWSASSAEDGLQKASNQ